MADTEMVEKAETEQVEEKSQEEKVTEEEKLEEEVFDKDRAMATIKNLRKFEKEAAKLSKELESYKLKEEERKKAELSEIDRLKLEKQEADQKLRDLTLKEQRREVAEKVKLPFGLADRIKGETPEEMEADAKQLFESLPKATPKTGITNPGDKATEPTTQRFGSDINPFDPNWVRANGGGAIIKE
jgi:hypothetical protein